VLQARSCEVQQARLSECLQSPDAAERSPSVSTRCGDYIQALQWCEHQTLPLNHHNQFLV